MNKAWKKKKTNLYLMGLLCFFFPPITRAVNSYHMNCISTNFEQWKKYVDGIHFVGNGVLVIKEY